MVCIMTRSALISNNSGEISLSAVKSAVLNPAFLSGADDLVIYIYSNMWAFFLTS